jgi:hypothetical protein
MSESNPSVDKAYEEGQKLAYDSFKHLTTLSTGSILLLATFLKDVFKNPEWTQLVGWTFGLFMVTIVASLIVMVTIAHSVSHPANPSTATSTIGAIGLFIAVGSFLGAIGTLSVFFLRNYH